MVLLAGFCRDSLLQLMIRLESNTMKKTTILMVERQGEVKRVEMGIDRLPGVLFHEDNELLVMLGMYRWKVIMIHYAPDQLEEVLTDHLSIARDVCSRGVFSLLEHKYTVLLNHNGGRGFPANQWDYMVDWLKKYSDNGDSEALRVSGIRLETI